MFIDFIHRLLKPLTRWHAEHRAEIIADWLADNDPQMAEAVALLRESRSARLRRARPWEKKRARRKALRKLRTACQDPVICAAVRKQFPPLPQTWS